MAAIGTSALKVVLAYSVKCDNGIVTTGCSEIQFTIMKVLLRVIKSRMLRRAGHVARVGEGTGVYRVSVGRPEGKR